MAVRKKIIKASVGVKLDTSVETPAKQFRKFKIGSQEFDLTDEFMKDLENDLVSTGSQGQGVAELMGMIKSGDISGIDEGGQLYGNNIGAGRKKTRRNRICMK